MEPNEHLVALARDGAAFGDACQLAGLSAGVDSCPGWSVADLLWHLTEVHDFWRTIVAEQRSSPKGMEEPPRPANDDLLASYRSGLDALLSTFASVDPTQANWTWASDHSAGFVIRRMAQETAVHRWDADKATGKPLAIESTLASDGIDEFLAHFLTDVKADAPAAGGSVHLHCTDVAGEWMVRPTEAGGLNVIREHAKGDAAMRGAANDLLLVLWRRLDLNAVDVVGDKNVAARFVARTNLE